MTFEQALEMNAAIIAAVPVGKHVNVEFNPYGDGAISVILKVVNPRAGDVTVVEIREFAPELAGAYVRQVLGRATKRAREAFARRAAERACNNT